MSTATTQPTQTATLRMLEAIGAGSHMIERAAAYTEYDDPRPYDVQDGIAIIDISGPLSASESWWKCSYPGVVREVTQAVEDSEVQGIILRVNSPGGETDRAFESAALIEEAAKQKPTWCVADVNAYSAGYLLACAADRIYAAPISGGVGSIGVYCLHLDYSGMLEQAGIDVTEISAGKGKTDGSPWKPLSAAALKDIKANVDRLYGEFVAYVARRRNMTEESIRNTGAALKQGAASAIEAGLADRAGSLETAVAEMSAYLRAKQFSTAVAGSAAANLTKGEHHMSQANTADTAMASAATQQTAAPPTELLNQARAEGYAQGIAAAEQIVAMCAIADKPASFALDFITSKKSVAEVQGALLAAKVAAAGAETINQTKADTGAKSANTDTQEGRADSALLALSERLYGKGGK